MGKTGLEVPLKQKISVYLGLVLSLIVIAAFFFATYYIHRLLAGFFAFIFLIFLLKPEHSKYSMQIDLEHHKDLKKVVSDVANRLNMESPTEVVVLPGTSISVMGYWSKRLRIGMASLRNLDKEGFKAILAHEFGHLYGADTVIGGEYYSGLENH